MARRRPTLQDLAEASGFSVALVSIVMRDAPGASDETRAHVKEVADRIGYQPNRLAQALRRTRSGSIGVVLALGHSFYTDFTSALYRAAFSRPYDLVLSAHLPGRTEREAVETLLRERCEAIVIIGPTLTEGELARYTEEVPLVVFGRRLPDPVVVDVVRSDDQAGAAMAVDHLVSLGHRSIAHIDGATHAGAPERLAGYLGAMERHGLAGEARVARGGIEEHDGFRAAMELLGGPGPRPTAVFAFDDECAAGVLAAAATLGIRVPEDLSVVGYDDSGRARAVHVPLTTVSQVADGVAAVTLERAIAQAGQRTTPLHTVLEPALVVRRSAGPAPSDP